jgi:hypothetical protein
MSTKIFGKYRYSRSRSILQPGDLVKVIDYEGNYNFFRLGRKEPMGGFTVQYTSAADGIAAGAASSFSEYRFTEPGQEGRLFQFRPIVFAVRRGNEALSPGRGIFAPIPDIFAVPPLPPPPPPIPALDTHIPMGVAAQLRHPAGTWRWGTDFKRDINVPTPGGPVPNPAVGGVDGGFLEAPLAPFIDDPSELWDFFTMFGHTMEVRLINRTDYFWPPGLMIGGAGDTKDYFVTLMGAKYILLELPAAIVDKLEKRTLDYQPVVIGGIPTVTTRA